MANRVSIQRVTVVADAVLESMLIQNLLRLGARGYTISDCRGKGEHGIVDNLLSGASSQIRIETIVQPVVADAIFDYLEHSVFDRYAVTAWIDQIEVSRHDRF